MKLKYIYTLSVAAALLATACTDELGVQDLPVESGKGYTVKVEASMNPSSRMAIQNDGVAVNYYWTADDSFTVFDTRHNQQTEFTINPDSFVVNSSKTSFIGTPEQAYSNGQKLYAVFNKKEQVQLDENGNVDFDLSNQNGQLNEDFQYMWGDATYKEGQPLEFIFRHLATTLMVKIPVPEGVESMSNVTLYSPNLVSRATLVLNEAPYDTERQFGVGDLVYSYDEHGSFNFSSVTVNGTFTPVDGYVTLYIYTLAAKQYHASTTWYNGKVRPFILFTDEDGLQHVSTDYLDEKEMEVGAVYSLEVQNTLPLVDFENEEQVSGDEYEPYQIANADQMFSLMMRSMLRLRDRNTNSYHNRSYQLTNDIELDTRSVWYPIYFDNTVFDGNGKTISGEMNVYAGLSDVGLIGYLWYGTIKDLTFNAKMSLVYKPGWTISHSAGTIVGYLDYGSKMLRCFSAAQLNSNQTINGPLGGLVGEIYGSTIEYCGFSGTIVSDRTHYNVGGLVGSTSGYNSNYPIKINGCYSDGSIKGVNVNGRIGGLVGMYSDPALYITNCWCNPIFESNNNEEFTVGGIVGMYSSNNNATLQPFQNCYWGNGTEAWMGEDKGYKLDDCAPFEGAIPSTEQLQKLNYAIMASGLMFSEDNGRLVKSDKTGVPPSDIENW